MLEISNFCLLPAVLMSKLPLVAAPSVKRALMHSKASHNRKVKLFRVDIIKISYRLAA
jgi:hypothetical protein